MRPPRRPRHRRGWRGRNPRPRRGGGRWRRDRRACRWPRWQARRGGRPAPHRAPLQPLGAQAVGVFHQLHGIKAAVALRPILQRAAHGVPAHHAGAPFAAGIGLGEGGGLLRAEGLIAFRFDADEGGGRGDRRVQPGVAAAGPGEAHLGLDLHLLGWPIGTPGRGGRAWGRARNQPKALAASAAELSGASNLPVPSSFPGLRRRAARTRSAGTPGRKTGSVMGWL